MSLRTVGSAQQLDANLPVTALVTFQLKEQRLVLHGCGTFVRLVDEQTGSVVHKLQALTRHNVHGLLPLGVRQVPACQRDQELFLAWGGPAVRLLCVGYDDSGDGRTMRLSVQSSEHLASDWILDAEISQARGPLSPEAVLVTAHNVLLGVVITRTPAGSVWRLRTTELASGLKSILYSADVVWLSPTQILVAAGTVFGEIVVWSHFLPASAAGQAESVTHHFFTGHEGSIFGVDIAPAFTTPTTHQSCRLLASCSDDRTIRLWDISDCSSGTSINTHGKTANDHETGFGNSYSHESSVMQGCVSATFGHASRIWGVEFLDTLSRDDALQVQLISRGEDATTQLWHATVRLNDCQRPCGGDIRHARKHEFHSGRNVWSLATHEEEDGFSVYSGGADGSIVMYPVPRIAQQDATIPSAMDATVAQPSSHKLSRYGFVSDQHILATTPAGHVLLGTVHHSAEETQTSVKCALVWDTIAQRDDLRGHSCMASDSKRGIAVLCGLAGEVILYRHDRRSFTRITEAPERVAAVYLLSASADCSIRFVTGHMSTNIAYFFNVSLDDEVNGSKVDRLVLQPPTTFCVTSAQYLSDLECVALGGRTGGLLLFNVGLKTTGGTTVPSLTLDHIHGRDTMTAILPLPKDGAHHDSVHTQCVLTTGRDGYYGIHRIGKSIQAYTLETIHRSSPPLGSHIEGAFLDAATRDLILYGFQSTRFTVFNETTRSVISAVECGGAHRAWAYLHSTDGARRSTFAWTKSSTLHISTQVGPDQRLVSVGGHGREIKALAVAGSTARLYGEPCRVLATGAEDTTIRLLVYRPSAVNDKHGSLQTIVVLNKHTTGLQHLQFSPCGKYLFSSGGLEEFFVWKINEVPALGLGAVLEGECPKSQLKSDLRITNFDISPILAHDNEVKEFLVALTYSNSEVKVSHKYCHHY
ncbi:hypothetical protein KEM52_002763 [Ascosphaera acerosa]|nr:hypothetical protein KEM52_002763 [Ascosphaera acerosa]